MGRRYNNDKTSAAPARPESLSPPSQQQSHLECFAGQRMLTFELGNRHGPAPLVPLLVHLSPPPSLHFATPRSVCFFFFLCVLFFSLFRCGSVLSIVMCLTFASPKTRMVYQTGRDTSVKHRKKKLGALLSANVGGWHQHHSLSIGGYLPFPLFCFAASARDNLIEENNRRNKEKRERREGRRRHSKKKNTNNSKQSSIRKKHTHTHTRRTAAE